MEVRGDVFISDDDQERVILSVKGLTEMLRFDFRMASFPQDALEGLQTAVTTERRLLTITLPVHETHRKARLVTDCPNQAPSVAVSPPPK